MRPLLRVEAMKLTSSPVGVTTTLAMLIGTLALLSGITAGVAGGNLELIAKAGPAGELDWNGLVMGATQITAVVNILGFGAVLAWMFGREFVEGTIAGLFALPASRTKVALAKLTIYALWALIVCVALPLGVLILGFALSYGLPNADAWVSLGRLFALGVFSTGLAVPVAWCATVTRSLLAAIGGTIAIVVVAQVGAISGAGAWMPLGAPALWAMSGGTAVTPSQLALALAIPSAFVVLTCVAWSRLQLDR